MSLCCENVNVSSKVIKNKGTSAESKGDGGEKALLAGLDGVQKEGTARLREGLASITYDIEKSIREERLKLRW